MYITYYECLLGIGRSGAGCDLGLFELATQSSWFMGRRFVCFCCFVFPPPCVRRHQERILVFSIMCARSPKGGVFNGARRKTEGLFQTPDRLSPKAVRLGPRIVASVVVANSPLVFLFYLVFFVFQNVACSGSKILTYIHESDANSLSLLLRQSTAAACFGEEVG